MAWDSRKGGPIVKSGLDRARDALHSLCVHYAIRVHGIEAPGYSLLIVHMKGLLCQDEPWQ